MANEYKVLRIYELTRVAAAGSIEKYYRHTVQTKGGTVLTVDIDEKDFSPEKAAPILAARAAQADKVLSL